MDIPTPGALAILDVGTGGVVLSVRGFNVSMFHVKRVQAHFDAYKIKIAKSTKQTMSVCTEMELSG